MATIVLDLRKGEAVTVLEVLTQRSENTDCPIKARGRNVMGRATIDVTLKTPGTKEDLRRENMGGRLTCFRQHQNHETEHSIFEWLAPREHAAGADDGNQSDRT